MTDDEEIILTAMWALAGEQRPKISRKRRAVYWFLRLWWVWLLLLFLWFVYMGATLAWAVSAQ